ncbi:DUF645 family protein [Vibrio mimicus]
MLKVQQVQSRCKPTSLDASRLLDAQHGKLGFIMNSIIAVIAFSLLWIL